MAIYNIYILFHWFFHKRAFLLRQLGRMLKETERNKGAKGIGKSVVPIENHTPTLSELGLDKKISSLAQKIADLTEEETEQIKKGVTVAEVLKEKQKEKKQQEV